MRRSTIAAIVVLTLVFGPLVVGGVGTVVLADDAPTVDNRELVEWMPFSLEGATDASWFGSVSAYVDDRLLGRSLGIAADATIAYHVFGDSTTDRVIVGTDGWLYYRDTLVVEADDPPPAEVADGLDALAEVLDRHGRTLIVTFAPNKAHIYPEHTPPRLSESVDAANAHMDALRAELNAYDWFIDIHPLMFERAEAGQAYYSNDTHWTDFGAMVWIEAVVDRIQPGIWSEEYVIEGRMQRHQGDIERILGVEVPTESLTYRIERPGVEVTEEVIETGGPDWLRTNASGAAMAADRVIVLHDSFVNAIRDQTAPFFGETLFANMNARDRVSELIEAIAMADVVVLEATERAAYDRFSSITNRGALEALEALLEAESGEG